jgi:hypothetical protein
MDAQQRHETFHAFKLKGLADSVGKKLTTLRGQTLPTLRARPNRPMQCDAAGMRRGARKRTTWNAPTL